MQNNPATENPPIFSIEKNMSSFAETSVLKMGKTYPDFHHVFVGRKYHQSLAFLDDFRKYPFINENPRGGKPWHQEQFGDPNDFRKRAG